MNAALSTPTSRRASALRDLADIRGGGTPSKSCAEFYSGSIPWVSPKDFKGNEILDAQDHISQAAIDQSATRLIPAGAVLVVLRSGVLKHRLPVAVNRVPVAINQDVKALICGAELDPNYLAHFLRYGAPKLLQRVRATTADNLPIDVLADLEIPVPERSEQRRVAAILDRAERIRLKCAGVVEILDKLVDQRFRAISSEGQRKCTVAEIGQVQGGIQVTPRRAAFPIEVPYLRVANVFRDRLDLSEVKSIRVTHAEMDRVKLNLGDVLIVEGHGNKAEIGRAAVWNGEISLCVHQNHLIRVRVDRRAAVPEYVGHAINSAESRSQIARFSGTTSGLNTISTADVKDLTIQLPTLGEQFEFRRVIQMALRLKSLLILRDAAARQLHKALEAKIFDGNSLL
jgi:type I restriction enzyme S subunit